MKHKTLTLFHGVLLLAVISGFVTILTGCSMFSGYKQAVITEGDISFSFEYPSSFPEPRIILGTIVTDIVLERPDPENDRNELDKQITVAIWKNSSYPDALTNLEETLKQLQNHWGDFTLHERSIINIGGLSGEKVIYSGRFEVNIFTFDHMKWQEVFLDYQGMIWIISYTSDADVTDDNAEEEFEHLINSFKFLD